MSHRVPPVPKDLPPAEMQAFRLWRSGLTIRVAAAEAGISPATLFQIVFPEVK